MEETKKSAKWLVWVVVVVIVAIVGLSIFKKPNETGPIKLGFISALSGEAAAYGEVEKNATEMAVSEINNNGGVNGRKIEVIYEDGKCNGKDALNAINKLVSVDGVKVVLGGSCSSETMAIIPVIKENKVLLFSAVSSNPTLTGASKYFFRNFPSDFANGTVDGGVMAKLYKKVALVSENADYTMGVRKVVQDVLKEKGVSIVFDEVYSSGSKDFRTLMSKIKGSGAEAVYFNPAPSATTPSILIKQAKEMGLNIPIHANPTFMAADAIGNGGKLMNGVISSDNSTLSDKGMVVLDKYKKEYGKDPFNYILGSNYDRAYIIADAIKAVGYDPDKISEYLTNLKEYDGAIGKYSFDKNGDMVGIGFMAVTIKDGKEVPYTVK
jgi:branched-chain amino acid transport system substrate-binding protein